MKQETQQRPRDPFAFLRERAAQLWQGGDLENARRLLREIDEEQMKLFQQRIANKVAAAK